jgi:hypothetical protein
MKNSIEVKINGYNCGNFDERNVLGFVFGSFIEELSFMSDDAVKEMLSGVFNLISELFPGAFLSRKITYGNRVLEDFDRYEAMKFIADQYLSSEKMGLLPGFGVAICENVEGRTKVIRRLLINPEKQFISGLE